MKRSPADQLKIKYLNWEWSCSPERQSWPSRFSKEITCYSKGDSSHWRILTKPSKSWTLRKAEHQRIDAFKLWCWRKVLSPLDCKKIKPIIPKEINPEYSLEGLLMKLKLQSFVHLMRRADSLDKTPMLGKIEGRRRRGHRGWDGWMASPTQWTWVWANSGSWWWTGKPGCCSPWGCKELDMTERLNWTELMVVLVLYPPFNFPDIFTPLVFCL